MILIIGIPSERPVKLVTEAADKVKIPHLMLNQREMHFCDLSLKFENNQFKGLLKVQDMEYDLESFTGIYNRMMDYAFLPEIKNKVFNAVNELQQQKTIYIHHQLLQWMAITKCRIFNKPWDMLSNMSKPYQAQIIAKSGLKVPPHLITSNPKKVVDFKEKHREIIYKSISSARSIVKTFYNGDMNKLEKIKFLPVQFQQQLTGQNVRVHVVGNAIFATKIIANVVDYRYASRVGEQATLQETELPDFIKEKCFNLSAELKLPLCGIDLFLTEEGDYYCFEVNPSPGYSYYEESTGQEIAAAMVNWLEYGDDYLNN